VSSGHPAATAAGVEVLRAGGNAIDAAIAAQAVCCVVMPEACGLGGDMLALVAETDGAVTAINGTGCWPAAADASGRRDDGGASVTVPGLIDAWVTLHAHSGRLPLAGVLQPAVRLAREGWSISAATVAALEQQSVRLDRHLGYEPSVRAARPGDLVRSSAMADTLEQIAAGGWSAIVEGAVGAAMVEAVQRSGGALSLDDLRSHRTVVVEPIAIDWSGATLVVQPPMTQGVILAMAAAWIDAHPELLDPSCPDHLVVEATTAAFEFRDRCGEGTRLLAEPLVVDPQRAMPRRGPRAYLHTTGVATADAEGRVVSSLVSVFDDFGSAVYVAELGGCCNNRAGGFTAGSNAPMPGTRPVHTLAPALVIDGVRRTALATPGADGQVQTLLQILMAARRDPRPFIDALADSIAAPRWRSQDGDLLVEGDHPASRELSVRGHRIVPKVAGDPLFGAIVAASSDGARAMSWADGRRNVSVDAC
jgi:gamma-glutamyltranspeptidase/glutathione hydrolase